MTPVIPSDHLLAKGFFRLVSKLDEGGATVIQKFSTLGIFFIPLKEPSISGSVLLWLLYQPEVLIPKCKCGPVPDF